MDSILVPEAGVAFVGVLVAVTKCLRDHHWRFLGSHIPQRPVTAE
jgi:hypothetical protein